MRTDREHYPPDGLSIVLEEQQERASQPAPCEEALAIRYAAQVAWAELQTVPSYVEGQARAFIEECEALGIKAQGEGEYLNGHTQDSTSARYVVTSSLHDEGRK